MGKFSVLSGHVVSAVEAGFLAWKGFFFPPSNVKTRNLKPTPPTFATAERRLWGN